MGTMHHEDGTSEPIALATDEAVAREHSPTGESDEYHLEPCHDPRANSNIVHAFKSNETGHKGPAWARSKAYCEGYEAMFGPSSKHESDLN